MRTIAIANHKGGVGKTITAINLSACLAEKKRKVLLVDLDPQSNATMGLGVEPEDLTSTIFDCMDSSSRLPIDGVIINSSLENLYLAPSSIKFAGFEHELAKYANKEKVLLNAINVIFPRFDYIIIDCPPSLGYLTINGLRASSEVIIPLHPYFFSLRAIEQFMETIELMQNNIGHTLRLHILFTAVEVRTKISQEVMSEVREHFGDAVFKTIIRKNVAISEATSYGQPVLKYDPHSTGAKGYTSLTEEVLKYE